MSLYQVIVETSAERDFKKLPHDTAQRVDAKMQSLAADPRHPGCLRLAGVDLWRIRVGRIRVLYEIDDASKTVHITNIDDRSDVYRK